MLEEAIPNARFSLQSLLLEILYLKPMSKALHETDMPKYEKWRGRLAHPQALKMC